VHRGSHFQQAGTLACHFTRGKDSEPNMAQGIVEFIVHRYSVQPFLQRHCIFSVQDVIDLIGSQAKKHRNTAGEHNLVEGDDDDALEPWSSAAAPRGTAATAITRQHIRHMRTTK